jgi:AMP nucleosidase
VTEQFVRTHLEVGITALAELRDFGSSVRHLRFEERPG